MVKAWVVWTPSEREEWLVESYIEGMRKADRKVKFIHRVPLSANKGSAGSSSAEVEKMTREILDTLTVSDGQINIELKFNWSQCALNTLPGQGARREID